MGDGRADEIDWSSFSFQHGFRVLQFRPLQAAAAPAPEQAAAKSGAEPQVKQEDPPGAEGVKPEPLGLRQHGAAGPAAAAGKAEVKADAAGGVPADPVPGLGAAATNAAAPLGQGAHLRQD